MALTGVQIKALREALEGAYDQMTLEQVLLEEIDRRLDLIVNVNASFSIMLFQLIKAADEGGWFADLVRAVRAGKPGNQALKGFADSLPAGLLKPQRPPDPFQVCFLWDIRDLPLVDRRILRDTLASFYASNGARVVVVNGPARSGKSYSFQLVRYLFEQKGGFEPVLVDLTESAGLDFGPDYVATRIAARMHIEPPSADMLTKASQDPRWAKELGTWIVDRVPETGKVWWIVIDGILQAAGSNKGTLALIGRLADAAARVEPNLRLVLLGYDKASLSTDPLPRVVQEDLTPLERLDLLEFFEKLLEQQGVESEDALAPAVDSIVGQLPPPYLGKALADLPGEVKKAAEKLGELTGGAGA